MIINEDMSQSATCTLMLHSWEARKLEITCLYEKTFYPVCVT